MFKVKRLKGWKAGVIRMFVTQDGNTRDESNLSGEEKKQFRQKIADLLIPLAYEEIVGDPEGPGAVMGK